MIARPLVRDAATVVQAAGALALLAYVPIALGAGGVSPRAIASCAALAMVASLVGHAAFILLRFPSRPGFDAVGPMVVGVLLSSALTLGLVTLLRLDAIHAFGIVALLAVSGWGAAIRMGQGRVRAALSGTDLIALAIVLAAVVLWTRGALKALPAAESTGLFSAWMDFFLHAAEITGLRHYSDLAGTSPYLAGTPQPFYHRASYALPAAYAALAADRSLAVALQLWLPLGLVLVGLSAYAAAALLWSRTAGLAAVVAVMLLPDPSMLWPGNALLGYHWLMQVAPGSGYAMAAILPSLALMAHGLARKRRTDVAIGLVVIGLAGAFRAHLALLGLIAAVPLALMAIAPKRPGGRLALAIGVASSLAALVLIFERIELAPHFLSAPNEVGRFMDTLHLMQSGYMEHYRVWTASAGEPLKALAGVVLLTVGAFGVLVPALAVLTWPRRWRTVEASVPWLVLLGYLFLVVLVPTPAHGDSSDLKHRPFVLVYAVLAVWAAGLFVFRLPKFGRSAAVAAMLAVAALLAAVPMRWGRDLQASTTPEWGRAYARVPVPAHVFETAGFVRARSGPADIVATSDADPLAVFVGLSERPAYLARYELFEALGGEKAVEARRRHDVLEDVLLRRQPLEQFLANAGVRWFVATGDMLQSTAPTPVFESGAARAFVLPR